LAGKFFPFPESGIPDDFFPENGYFCNIGIPDAISRFREISRFPKENFPISGKNFLGENRKC
jgi:hypothetical protein